MRNIRSRIAELLEAKAKAVDLLLPETCESRPVVPSLAR
jgi:hypothetical protein